MPTSKITALLGGKKALGKDIKSQMDLVDVALAGVTKESLQHLAKEMGESIRQIAELLPLTERTIQRYQAKRRFSSVVSESILQIAEVVARGAEVFEDKERFLEWLVQPSAALGNQTPKSLMRSRFGTDMVLAELTRIEHGVLS